MMGTRWMEFMTSEGETGGNGSLCTRVNFTRGDQGPERRRDADSFTGRKKRGGDNFTSPHGQGVWAQRRS